MEACAECASLQWANSGLARFANMGKRCILHQAAKGVCRNHRGEPAVVRMPSAGIHLHFLSHHPETSPVGALRLPDVLAFGNNARSVRCS